MTIKELINNSSEVITPAPPYCVYESSSEDVGMWTLSHLRCMQEDHTACSKQRTKLVFFVPHDYMRMLDSLDRIIKH